MLKLNRTDVENLTLFKRWKRKLISVPEHYEIHAKEENAVILLFFIGIANFHQYLSPKNCTTKYKEKSLTGEKLLNLHIFRAYDDSRREVMGTLVGLCNYLQIGIKSRC